MILNYKTLFPKNFSHLTQLFDVYQKAGSSLRLVGGSVRDAILNKPSSDIDFATPLLPQAGLDLLQKNTIVVKPIGLKHGTITVIMDGTPYQITTLRQDAKTYGRYADVVFTNSWEQDALRRDLTINSLYADANGVVYDYTNGLSDILSGTVRFIGSPQDRIKEDYLRILRFFRFHAHYGRTDVATETLKACEKLAPQIRSLSRERIRYELFKLLQAENPLSTLQNMADYQILLHLDLGKVCLSALSRLIKLEKFLNTSPSPWCRLFVAFPELSQFKKNLCLSRKEEKFLNFMSSISMDNALDSSLIAYNLFHFGQERMVNFMLIQSAKTGLPPHKTQEIFDKLNTTKIPLFPISGKDLEKIGLSPGPLMGEIIEQCLNWWLIKDPLPSREDCLTWIHENFHLSK